MSSQALPHLDARPLTLYLDTSDLSYLAKGSGPGGSALIGQQRARLDALVASGRVRLCVSIIHLAELAIDDETREAVLAWWSTVPALSWFTTPAEDIFRAELRGEPVVLEARPVTVRELRALTVRTRFGFEVGAVNVARMLKAGSRLAAIGDRFARRGERLTRGRRGEPAREEMWDALLAGDFSKMPRWIRPIAHLYRRLAASRETTSSSARSRSTATNSSRSGRTVSSSRSAT